MASARTSHHGIERRPFVCRVRFHAPLRDAKIVRPGAEHRVPGAVAVPAPVPAPPPPPATPPRGTPRGAAVAMQAAEIEAAEAARGADRSMVEAVLQSVRQAVTDLRTEDAARLGQWQKAAVELAMTMATRLLHDRVQAGEFPMEAKVREMLDQLGGDDAVAVHLNPLDLEVLKRRLGDEPLSPEGGEIRLVTDPSLGRGDCRIEGRESMLLSEVSRELQEIRDELFRSLGHARS
jgi:flagellar biosynthesis/type III secretory pathway protein FliH